MYANDGASSTVVIFLGGIWTCVLLQTHTGIDVIVVILYKLYFLSSLL